MSNDDMSNDDMNGDDMTDPTDELIQRLAAADPIDGQDLPTAQEQSAQQLLENIMTDSSTNSGGPQSPPAMAPHDAADILARNNPTPAPTPIRRNRSQGRLALISVAAAVLLLVGGLLVFSPDNTPSAVATVRSAAAATADSDTGRIATTFDLSGTSGVESEQISGRFDASYAGDDVAVSLQIDESSDASLPGDFGLSDGRLVDDVFYLNVGGQWVAVDTKGLLGSVVSEFVDPRAVLDTVQGLTETTDVGTVEIDGVQTTRFQSVIDLGDESLSQAGWMAFEGLDVEAEGEVTLDLYVDDDGALRQLDLNGEVRDASGGDGTGTFSVSTKFFDIGADITVEAPADVEVIDPLADAFEE